VGLALPTRLAGRRAVIERRLGSRYVRLAVVRVSKIGRLTRTLRLRRDRARGATGIAGVRAVRIRVRLLKKGRQPAVGGAVASVRLP
jgi:hypothetical protein